MVKKTSSLWIFQLLRSYPYLACFVLGSIFLPITLLLAVAHNQAVTSTRIKLESVTVQGARQFSSLIRASEITLNQIKVDLESSTVSDTELWKSLQRLAYDDPRFREIGIINEEGFLTLTSLGPVDPPISVESEIRANLQVKELQIIGPVETVLMQERSIALVLPTEGKGEINILVNPVVLSTYWDSAYELDLGPDGFLAYVNVKDNRIIAGEGFLPVDAQALMESSPKGKIRVTYPIEGSEIYIIGEVSKRWALRNWQNLLFFGGPVAILSGSLLIGFLCQLLYSAQRLGYNLNQGLSRNEFRVYYQPIVDLQTGYCVGSEALLRWQHRRQGLLLPGIFVPIAEKTGLINKISEWLTEKVLEEQSQTLGAYPNLYVSINLSPVQLNSGASDKLTRQLIERDENLVKKVMFEITESTWIQDKETPALEAIARLRSLGMRIALDDFGTGHTGISYLHKLNFDYLKIDRIYTAASDAHSNVRIILDGIINLGRQLQVELIAEGVETEAQRRALLSKNVRYGQGYLFAYPMPIEEFEHFLKQNLAQKLLPHED